MDKRSYRAMKNVLNERVYRKLNPLDPNVLEYSVCKKHRQAYPLLGEGCPNCKAEEDEISDQRRRKRNRTDEYSFGDCPECGGMLRFWEIKDNQTELDCMKCPMKYTRPTTQKDRDFDKTRFWMRTTEKIPIEYKG